MFKFIGQILLVLFSILMLPVAVVGILFLVFFFYMLFFATMSIVVAFLMAMFL